MALALGCVSLSGCGSSQAEPVTAQRYQENARRAYREALRELKDHDYEDAQAQFEAVKRDYAYTRYARLAELRLADVAFEQETYPEAVTAYRTFVHEHPHDPEVSYARFRICDALFQQTGNTIMLPPEEERDLAVLHDAFNDMQSFVQELPNHQKIPEVSYMLEVVTGVLARHELYVARFYLGRGEFQAAAARCRYSLDNYPDSGLQPEALVLLGETYLKMKRHDEARQAFTKVLDEYPASAFAEVSKNFLAQTEPPVLR